MVRFLCLEQVRNLLLWKNSSFPTKHTCLVSYQFEGIGMMMTIQLQMNCVWIFLQNLQISEIVIFLEPRKSIAVLKFLVKPFKFTRWNVGKKKNLENKKKDLFTGGKWLQKIIFPIRINVNRNFLGSLCEIA